MKTEIEQLVERLSSKELTFGCWVEVQSNFGNPMKRGRAKLSWWNNDNWCSNNQLVDSEIWDIIKVLGHDIMIGDVIKKLRAQEDANPESKSWERPNMLLKVWEPLGFDKSLQTILDCCEWGHQTCPVHGPVLVNENCSCDDFPVELSYAKLFELLLRFRL